MPEGPGQVHDLAVIGAGPAGMSAAVTAADAGCSVAVVDLSERPGGQYWRWGPATADGRYHHGWRTFVALRARFDAHAGAGRILYLPGHAVFAVAGSGPFTVHAVADERRRLHGAVDARTVVVATGAFDRSLPFPGWTRPGVMAAGGAQALLKGSGVVAGRRVVVAGTGPLLLPVAAGLVQAGARVLAVAEAGDPFDYVRPARSLIGSWRKVPEAAAYLAVLARHRVSVLRRHAVIAAHGDDQLRSVTIARVTPEWSPVAGTERTIDTDVLAVGYGFVPQVELIAEAGAALALSEAGTLAAVVTVDQETTIRGMYAAGETTGVGGADLAIVEGTLAGMAVARQLRADPAAPDSNTRRRLLRRRGAAQRFGTVMDRVHAVPAGWTAWVDDETIVCRCEEVTVGALRAARRLGADDARSIKLLARPGMGWCQGRMCGAAVAGLLAAWRVEAGALAQMSEVGISGAPAGGFDGDLRTIVRRPLAQPVPLRVLAELAPADEAERW
jgi:thioredoxin reductase